LASVTGTAYTSENHEAPVVRLFTKEGCTLCDKVKDVLMDIRDDHPHSLEQVDITDPEHKDWFSKYKYDIPVLHIGEQYWMKHRIDVEEAKEDLTEALEGRFVERQGQPDAGETERRQAERESKK
jgi:glutaredoxin